jgi:hypothetical protein
VTARPLRHITSPAGAAPVRILADAREGERVEVLHAETRPPLGEELQQPGEWILVRVTWQRPRFKATMVRIEGADGSLSPDPLTLNDWLPARRPS